MTPPFPCNLLVLENDWLKCQEQFHQNVRVFFKSVLLNVVKVKQVAKSCFKQNDNNQHTKQKNTHK